MRPPIMVHNSKGCVPASLAVISSAMRSSADSTCWHEYSKSACARASCACKASSGIESMLRWQPCANAKFERGISGCQSIGERDGIVIHGLAYDIGTAYCLLDLGN